MDDLIAFLKARLDEDEAALRAVEDNGEPWRGQWAPDDMNFALRTRNGWSLARAVTVEEGFPPGVLAHIARHDPARVLREVEARQQRLALYLDAREALAAVLKAAPALDDPAVAHSHVRERVNVNQASGRFAAFEMSVRLDAAIWCDHPDYRPGWKP